MNSKILLSPSFRLLPVLAMILILVAGCGNHKEDDRYQEGYDDGYRAGSSEGKKSEPPCEGPDSILQCNDLFPDTVAVDFNMVLISDPTDPVMKFKVEPNCPYDLEEFSDCCKCKCTLNTITISGPLTAEDTISVSAQGGSANSYMNRMLPHSNQVIDLKTEGLEVQIEDGLEIYLDIQGVDASAYTAMGGGLCVVVNIGGGGN